jgi:hypothetical protein
VHWLARAVIEVTARKGSTGPATLMQAHDLLTRMRPSLRASALTWLKYYRHSAAVYAEVAEIDRGHHHEALYWANRERAKASELQAELAGSSGPAVVESVKKDTVGPTSGTTVHIEQ